MKHLLIIMSMAIIAGFTALPIVLAGERIPVKVSEKDYNDKEVRLLVEKMRAEMSRVEKEVRLSVEKIHEEMGRSKEEFRASAEKARAENVRAEEKLSASIGKIAEASVKTGKESMVVRNGIFASSEYKREIEKEFTTGSSASLSIDNEFGNIRILEGTEDKITFKITITGKGKSHENAKELAESVDINFTYKGNDISAKTVFGKIKCNNCKRSVDYEVYVPEGATLTLDNQFGDIKINNTVKPFNVKLKFGKLYANEIADAELNIQHGGATINKCGSMKLKSSFSKYKLGKVETLSGSISHGGIDVDELSNGDLKSDFSNLEIGKLKNSLNAKDFSFGTLKILNVEDRFSNIKVDARFSKVQIALTKSHNFKAALYTNFGSVKTGDIVFYEKTLDKKDVVVGTAGKIKDPSATVEISNEHGNINLQ